MKLNILHNIEFVKQKIQEAGKKPCWLCVDDFHNQQPRGDFPASVDINDINLAKAQKNLVGSILRLLKGENEPRLSKKSIFSLRLQIQDPFFLNLQLQDPQIRISGSSDPDFRILKSTLLDTSEITPQRKG